MTRIKLILIALIATMVAIMLFPTKNNFQPKRYGNIIANTLCIYTHHKQQRINMNTSLTAGLEMTNTLIFMTTTRINTPNITKN